MLSPENVDALLDAAESSELMDSRLSFLRKLVQSGADAETWARVSDRVMRLVDVERGERGQGDWVQLIADLPMPQADDLLRRIAADVPDPDSLRAARIIDQRYGSDLVAAHVEGLVERSRSDPGALRTLACLPLERYDIPADVLEAGSAADSPDVRLWAAIALAKMGDAQPLLEVLTQIENRPPTFMSGDPRSAYDQIREAAPVSNWLHETLVGWHDDFPGRDPRIVIGALTGEWNAEGHRVWPNTGGVASASPMPDLSAELPPLAAAPAAPMPPPPPPVPPPVFPPSFDYGSEAGEAPRARPSILRRLRGRLRGLRHAVGTPPRQDRTEGGSAGGFHGTEPQPAGAEPSAATSYDAYPLLEAPDVVVAREPFEITVGLDQYFDPSLAVTGPIHVEAPPPTFEIEVEIVVDPRSLEIAGHPVHTLTVTADEPYPSVTVTGRAHTHPELSDERIIRLLFRHDDAIVGLAHRSLTVVGSPGQVATARRPAGLPKRMLDLAPLLGDSPPDLVVGIYRADEPGDVYVWDVYGLSSTSRLPDEDRRTRIDASARDFATYMKQAVTVDKFRGLPTFRNLVGYGDLIQSAMPRGVRDALRALLDGAADTAPAVLFLTEEPFVPWELAVLRPGLETPYGGSAPFLGAHLAVSRWPSNEEDPPTAPTPRLGVTRQGVLTAKYEGVKDWKRLPAAEEEAMKFAAEYQPATEIRPIRREVESCLEGRTALDLLHVALHGQFDPSSREDGLVLLTEDGDGYRPDYLTALGIRGLRQNQSTTPFVFLNACQVGAADAVLGSYAGFATAILRTGAAGVVAPLWNIEDDIAAKLSARFYAAAYGATPVPVAEILRRFRAEYTREAVEADPAEVTPTYVAYQLFGHPRFTIRRTTQEE